MRFCWEIEGVWKTSDWYKGSPVFHAEKGNYYVYIQTQEEQKITCKWGFLDESDIQKVIEWLDVDYLRQKCDEKKKRDLQ